MAVEKTRVFNETESYEYLLNSMRKEFLEKWDNNILASVARLTDYDVIGTVGAGAFGKVRVCRNLKTRQLTAVKFMQKQLIVEQKQVRNVITEKRVMQTANFPFILSLHFARKDNDYLYLGQPFHSYGDMFALVQKLKRLSESHAKFYASQIFMAFQYLHNCNILYRDLKTENILITSKGYIRITDFGFAKRVLTRATTLCGTPEYFAPEIIQAQPYSMSVDWWTFGVLVYELVIGHTPWSKYNTNPMVMYQKICDGEYKLPTKLSSDLRDLVSNLLRVDITQRYGCLKDGSMQIKNHKWFDNTYWIPILNQTIPAPYLPDPPSKDLLDHYPKIPNTEIARSNLDRYSELFKDF